MTLTYDSLLNDWPDFSQRLNQFIEHLGLGALNLQCDHVALRVNDITNATSLAEEFAQHGQVISNNIINGRPILIIKLDKPLILAQQPVYCVELPFPGKQQYPQVGWEHAELVLPCDATDCEQLAQALTTVLPSISAVINQQTQVKVKFSSPQSALERLANPTIAFKHEQLCVKIHNHSIETIIASERQES